ncbi:hypothetical protein EA462_11860 [Natrarchaeobius halalkaliphilus]|uniref:RING-type E3 ubiquitin transferase n=1 Tax=Natrarchaeobius halalkaliphilus TaxID=1679091 RepID=A0A3N6LML0_9EURY|nr:GIDE domain-containing protein [Natrarchaeobius halalkaliphilus]RQG89067.1 hypothetical protein EA462_11860 [Natrarchaeobius halalkaliphilus]
MDLVSLAIGGILAALGVAGIWTGTSSLRQWRRLGADDPVPVREAISRSGSVEVEGAVREHETTLESPVMDESCVAYEYTIEQRRNRGGKRSGSRWRTIEDGTDRRPFVLEDESGRAYVDPDGASLSLERERTRNPNGDSPLPGFLRSLNVDFSINIGGPFGAGIGNRRYTERRLDLDGHCYVVGQAERSPAGIDADVAIVGGESPTFLISDATEGETRRRLLLRGSGFGLAGVGCVALGLWILVSTGVSV